MSETIMCATLGMVVIYYIIFINITCICEVNMQQIIMIIDRNQVNVDS